MRYIISYVECGKTCYMYNTYPIEKWNGIRDIDYATNISLSQARFILKLESLYKIKYDTLKNSKFTIVHRI